MKLGDNNYDLISRKQAVDGIGRMAHVSTMLHETDVIMFLQSLPPVQRETEMFVDEQPTAEKARWLINSDGYYPYCSACMAEPESGVMTDFCPNCGADMRGKTKWMI